ncbi:sialidase family protein [Candidatus Formimonas warabiya]|uniref:Exo-alpha-sialidase n=1 Tax=Formimonas warabiya TaxID=1761012 RepID=A0A3G1KRT7_FORW1|nr:sialidase family protein [Candidatus Formimonas warabiya]ATW25150.1 hypothetical protein DCMF_10555 [Candidatus Formimonas warabiya]
MKSKILSMLGTTKKKAGAVVLCGALVAAIGVGTAYAAGSITSLQVQVKNGVKSYSTDGGKTWAKKVPDGVTVNDKDGKITVTNGVPPKDADGKGLLSKVENGVRSYSTDGGKTWSEKAPDGVTETETTDGKFTFTNGDPSEDAHGMGLMVKVESGVKLYSTDGGKTWSENAPDGVTIGKDGAVMFTDYANRQAIEN